MAKLRLNPDPTFSAKVEIPVAGGDSVSVSFTFKHRTRDELQAFVEASKDRNDIDTIMEAASGWELADAFTRENIGLLVQNYIASPKAVFEKYLDELVKARTKN